MNVRVHITRYFAEVQSVGKARLTVYGWDDSGTKWVLHEPHDSAVIACGAAFELEGKQAVEAEVRGFSTGDNGFRYALVRGVKSV